jgi:hypothetical protein
MRRMAIRMAFPTSAGINGGATGREREIKLMLTNKLQA